MLKTKWTHLLHPRVVAITIRKRKAISPGRGIVREEGWFGQPKYSTHTKTFLRCTGFCLYFLHFLYMWSRLDHHWSNVHQQDHRSGCLLKRFRGIDNFLALSGLIYSCTQSGAHYPEPSSPIQVVRINPFWRKVIYRNSFRAKFVTP